MRIGRIAAVSIRGNGGGENKRASTMRRLGVADGTVPAKEKPVPGLSKINLKTPAPG